MSEQESGLPPQQPNPWASPTPPAPEGAPAVPPAPKLPVEAPPPTVQQEPAASQASIAPAVGSGVKQADPVVEVAPEVEKSAAECTVDELVAVNVPRAFNLRLDYEKVKHVAAGPQRMLRADAEHWYSKANGVTVIL